MMGTGNGAARRRAGRAATAYAPLAGNREDVLRRHLPLVRRVVQRLAARKPPHIELDDLVSWGIVGLLDAIGKYDPRKEASFSTYAQFRIRGAILDHLRSLDWVPRSVRQKASLIEKTAHTLEGALGRPPSEEEIARELGLSLETNQELLAHRAPYGVVIGHVALVLDADAEEALGHTRQAREGRLGIDRARRHVDGDQELAPPVARGEHLHERVGVGQSGGLGRDDEERVGRGGGEMEHVGRDARGRVH